MFWLLIVVFFMVDGSKHPFVQLEPTEAACTADANLLATDAHAHPMDGLLGAGVQCDGPFDDPTVPKTSVKD